MQKLRIFITISFFIFMGFILEARANELDTDYLAYEEIVLSSGKLIKYLTEDEIKEIEDKDVGFYIFHIEIEPILTGVHATYISSVKECMENSGTTEIKYNVEYQVETNQKVSFTSSGSISSSTSATMGKIKSEASAKASVEYNESTSKSVKEKNTISLTVEPNSQYMVFIKGTMNISNGYVRITTLLYKTGGFYELVTLESQYAALEKRVIVEWKE